MRRRISVRGALIVTLVLLPWPAFAALSPYYQSVAEIQKILTDPRLADALPGQMAVVSVVSTATDVYEVKTGQCSVTVTVVDVPAKEGTPIMVGPRQFDLQFGPGQCN
jgi:hypothetical protein